LKISIVALGNKMPAWVSQGYHEYAKRLPRELSPRLLELPLVQRSKSSSVGKLKQREAEQILSAIPPKSRIIALDVKGKSFSTEVLADKLASWQMEAQDVSIVIGGPDGLAKECLTKAHERWSLSALTLPHPLVRIVLLEQLYRAWTILSRHPYHK